MAWKIKENNFNKDEDPFNIMNPIIKTKIYNDNISLFWGGILILFGGIIFDLGFYFVDEVIIVPWVILFPLFGASAIVYSLYKIFNYKSNPAYLCWKKYGEKDKNVTEVIQLIEKSRFGEESQDLIISKKWIIQPSSLIFVKPEDIVWAFVSRKKVNGLNGYNQRIKLFTNFNLRFEVPCSQIYSDTIDLKDIVSEDVSLYFKKLKEYNKKVYFGYNEQFEAIWKKDPEDFLKNINPKNKYF